MIIPIIAIFAILTFITTMFIKNRGARNFFSTIFFLGLVLSIAAMLANDRIHFGMKGKNVTEEQVIYSAGNPADPANLLIYQDMGSEVEEDAYAYRLKPKGKIEQAVPARSKATNVKIRPDQPASIVTTGKRWVYKNDFYKMLFNWDGEDNKIAKQEVTIYYPDDTWVLLSTEQSKQLAEMSKKSSADQQEEMTQRTIEIRELAKTDPIAAGQMQVEMINEQLASF